MARPKNTAGFQASRSARATRTIASEELKQRIYKNRDLARADVFDYIAMFYNPTRRHNYLIGVSPDAFESPSI